MTNKEIVDKIRLYESKWGRLGHTNIMKPELNHSGLEGGNKMSNMTNDLIAFRQKVAAGREANKLAHRSTINVTDINKRYFEDLTSNGTLIHAGSLSHSNLNYGQKFFNKIDNYYADGRARYFWSKAEWDAYQREQQGQAQDKFKKEQAQKKTAVSKEAERGNDMSGYEDWKKEKVAEKTKQINNNKQADTAKKIQDVYRQGGAKAAAQEVTKTNEWKELLNVFDEITKAGYDVRTLSNEDKKKLDPQLQKRMDKAKDDYTRLLGSNSKSRNEIHDELEKVMSDHVEKSISRRDKTSLNAASSGREAAEKAGQKTTQKLQAKEKELQENIKERDQYSDQADKIDKEIKESDKEQESKVKEKENRKKEVIQDYYKNNPDATSFSEDFNKTVEERGKSNFTVTVHPDGEMVIYAPDFDKQIKELESKYKEVQKFYESDSKKLRLNNYKDEYERRELESAREYSRLLCLQAEQQLKELENKKQMRAYDEFDSVCRQMGINFDKYNLNEREGKYKSEVKHSSEEPEVMDEYSAFMERVKRGKEKNRLAHSTLISPADLNARYEQAIKDKCFLVHGGNFKYYNKIDLGNGKSRYFYTKAEWDAYQDGLGQAKYEQQKQDAPKKAIAEQKNNMAGYADWKKQQDLNKQRQETYNKNKAADEAIAKKLQQNSTIIKKQLQEQYEKNKEASKHEGDRWAKSITEATKIADAPGKDAQNKPDNVQPPVKMEEEVKQEVQQSTTMPINEAYTNVLNNIWNDQTINDWAYICAVRSVYGPSEENEKAVWECQAYIDNTLAQIYNEIGTMYGEAAVAEIDGVIGANLQSMYQTYYNQVLNEFTMMANQQAMNNMMFP